MPPQASDPDVFITALPQRSAKRCPLHLAGLRALRAVALDRTVWRSVRVVLKVSKQKRDSIAVWQRRDET